MAQQHLGSDYGSANPTTSQSVTMSLAVQVGDEIVVCARGGTINAPTDTIGNTYTRIITASFTAFELFRATSIGAAAAGANVVTVTQSSGRMGVAVHHLRGMDPTAPVDVTTDVNEGSGTSSATDAFSTSQANTIIIAMWGGSVTPTPEADYGGVNDEGPGVGRLTTCHRVASSVLSNETVNWTHGDAAYQCSAAAFKEAAAAGGDVTVTVAPLWSSAVALAAAAVASSTLVLATPAAAAAALSAPSLIASSTVTAAPMWAHGISPPAQPSASSTLVLPTAAPASAVLQDVSASTEVTVTVEVSPFWAHAFVSAPLVRASSAPAVAPIWSSGETPAPAASASSTLTVLAIAAQAFLQPATPTTQEVVTVVAAGTWAQASAPEPALQISSAPRVDEARAQAFAVAAAPSTSSTLAVTTTWAAAALQPPSVVLGTTATVPPLAASAFAQPPTLQVSSAPQAAPIWSSAWLQAVKIAGARLVTVIELRASYAPVITLRGSYAPIITLRASDAPIITLRASTMADEVHIGRKPGWFAGEDKKIQFPIFEDDDETPKDVTGYAFAWIVRRRDDDADPPVLQKTSDSGSIAIVGTYNADPAQNTQRVEVTITDTDTESLAAGTYRHSLKRTDDGSETVLAFGNAYLQRATAR